MGNTTLGGSTFVYNGIKQDYNFIETLNCLYELCDEVSVSFGGDDGTIEAIQTWIRGKGSPENIKWFIFNKEYWNIQQGREKLSHFSNVAISQLTTDWNFYLQADEILHENSFPLIREYIKRDIPAYLVTRFNLWGSPYTMLNVPQERKPCSSEVIRLAKTQYRCVGDAESLGVPYCEAALDVHIYHMGFVRNSVKHLEKIRHIQDEVFLIDHDKRIDGMEKFDPWVFFSPEDVIPIPEEGLPKFIKQWAHDRSDQ